MVVDARFTTLLDQIVQQRTNSAQDLLDVMKWVQANFEYDHHDASLAASAEHALAKRRGHCSDYHSFRTAYIEADGVPLSEPDPADSSQTAFSWMTVHDYRADRKVPYPFTDLGSLQSSANW